MTQDWKEMLASLRGDEPINTEPETMEPDAPDADATNPFKQTLHIILEKKGRKGKVATIIEGFTLDDEEVEKIASDLKRKIGTGGSSRGGEILLQGDWRERARTLLNEKGFLVK